MINEDQKNVVVTLPMGLYNRLRRDAKANDRSIGGEVRHRIKKTWEKQDAQEN
jgi:hypothetical protein